VTAIATTGSAGPAPGARRIPQTFECRPTPAGLPDTGLPDELMIDWTGIPGGATVLFYLPAVSADVILEMAGRLYGAQHFTRRDDHTVACAVTGVTYLPIPVGGVSDYAGLLTLELPPGMPVGQRAEAIIRQLTSSSPAPVTAEAGLAMLLAPVRRVLGAFQMSIPIEPPGSLLEPEERSLAFFRWILTTLEAGNRWYPVIERYIAEISLRVEGLGGNPALIDPSPVGAVGPEPRPEPRSGRIRRTGKIERLIYDRFGDFEGFTLETDTGSEATFYSRERRMAELARWAWQARIRATVLAPHREPQIPVQIVLHAPGEPSQL
jgi:hypothetical protein